MIITLTFLWTLSSNNTIIFYIIKTWSNNKMWYKPKAINIPRWFGYWLDEMLLKLGQHCGEHRLDTLSSLPLAKTHKGRICCTSCTYYNLENQRGLHTNKKISRMSPHTIKKKIWIPNTKLRLIIIWRVKSSQFKKKTRGKLGFKFHV